MGLTRNRKDLSSGDPQVTQRSNRLRVVDSKTLCDDVYMPLSDDEQKILSQIEQQLHETDPDLAKEVATTTVYSHAARNIKWSVLGFVVGLTVIILTLSISFWLAFVGFAIMLAAALYFEQNMRRLGKAGMNQLSMRVGSGGFRDTGIRRTSIFDRLQRRPENPEG
ncbi:MAG: hypothetical protein CL470_08740 [Acidimicrobiaceae bacterium]|nr:hypothetical protein [Acidimicrobiaceae bacterium]